MRNIPSAAELGIVGFASDEFCDAWDAARIKAHDGDTTEFDRLREIVDSRTYPRRQTVEEPVNRVTTPGTRKIRKQKFWQRLKTFWRRK